MQTSWVETIRTLLDWDPRAVEGAVVGAYLEGHDLTTTNPLLHEATSHPESGRVQELLAGLGTPTLDDTVKVFEVLVPALDADANGAVFTPSEIADHMARVTLTNDRLERGVPEVLDPSCGCGALLVAALKRICQAGKLAPSTVLPHLHGVDLDADSVRRAHVLLALTSLHLGEDTTTTADLQVADSLRREWDQRYDVVLANPPYVRYQNLPASDRKRLSEEWETLQKGNPNLFFAFFELLERVQDDTGVASFITPNNFFATQSAATLRDWLTRTHRLRQVIDFGHNRVFDALTYTAITVLGRPRTEGSVKYALVTEAKDLPGLTDNHYATQGPLGRTPWQLASIADQENIEKILSAGRPLGEVADIRYGVKTCRDRVYLVSGPIVGGYLNVTHEGVTYQIEEGVTRPHLVVPDARSESDIPTSTQRIIHPYETLDGKATVIPEDVMEERYPKALAYLKSRRTELDNRDKGKKSYATWYAYARTQALVPQGDKLLTPEYAGRPRFMLDERLSLFSNGCSVTARDGATKLQALKLILNSGILHYFVEVTSTSIDGGYKSYQKSRIAPFGIIDLSSADLEHLAGLTPGEIDDELAKRYEVTLPEQYRRG